MLSDSIGSLGLMIAFYYGLTGFACFWFYRNVPLTFGQSVSRRIVPLIGGIMLLVLFVYACSQYINPDYGYTSVSVPGFPWYGGKVGGVFALGIGVLLLGVVLMLIWRAISPGLLPRRDAAAEVLRRADPGAGLRVGRAHGRPARLGPPGDGDRARPVEPSARLHASRTSSRRASWTRSRSASSAARTTPPG